MPKVNNDSAIKLFGRTISLSRNSEVSANDSSSEPAPPLPFQDCSDHSPPSSSSSPREVNSSKQHEAVRDKEPSRKKLTSVQDDEASHQTTEDLKSPTSSDIFENPKTPSAERESSLPKSSKNGEHSDTTSVSQDKTPKKPDKILPCPRCNSMDTKFCYYNNYNVNQPRHFCKSCQRYWTAGGTMRNMPVGAGRRKNKNSSVASHYRQIMVPEALQAAKFNADNVLSFGSDSPLCDSMASSLSLAEKTQNGVLNGFHAPKKNMFVSYGGEDSNGDDNSVGASVIASTSSEKRDNAGSHESVDKSYQGFPPQLHFPGSSSPWPYQWNPAMHPYAFCQPTYPMSFYPAPAYWGLYSISPQSSVNHSDSNSPTTLGKHSRDGDILFPHNSQKEKPTTESNNSENNRVLIPKTLRIDDPNEAAKSSIWSTLGVKNEKGNSTNGGGGGLFKAFSSKGGGDKNHMVETSSVLQANPAALSRSLIFHERT